MRYLYVYIQPCVTFLAMSVPQLMSHYVASVEQYASWQMKANTGHMIVTGLPGLVGGFYLLFLPEVLLKPGSLLPGDPF